MDELDSKIIQLMMRNARMPVKEIAKQVNLTSPDVYKRQNSSCRHLVQAGIKIKMLR